jgi:hypothetical protein
MEPDRVCLITTGGTIEKTFEKDRERGTFVGR